MGQKVNLNIYHIGTLGRTWNSSWFSRRKQYVSDIREDHIIRKFVQKGLAEGGIDRIIIDRSAKAVEVILHVARPGVVIGRGGTKIDEIKQALEKMLGKKRKIKITIKEVPKMFLSAMVLVQEAASQVERRIPYRRVMKGIIDQAMKAGAQGVKIIMAGRLNGADIARRETLKQGKLPVSTIRSDIDYGRGVARTTYGAVGIKVWIYKGEKFEKDEKKSEER